MVFEEEMIPTVLFNTVVDPFSVYLTAFGLPIKLFLYFLNIRYACETVRGKAAPHQLS